jgi:predicted TIM-barrel fold metal-dependent hydrolase
MKKKGIPDFSAFLNIPIVDSHVHFIHPARIDDILSIMCTIPIQKLNLVCMPNLDYTTHNPTAVYFKKSRPEAAYISGSLDYSGAMADRAGMSDLFARQVMELKRRGFDGLKLIEGKPNVRRMIDIPLDGPEYEGLWSTLEREAFPVVFHMGDPEEFWDKDNCPAWAREAGWDYSDPGFPTWEDCHAEADRILARHPRLRIVFAHFGFLSANLERATHFLEDHPSVFFDLAPHIDMYRDFSQNPAASRRFFERFQDRILYGTDLDTRVLERGTEGYRFMLSIPWTIRSFLERDGVFSLPGKEEYHGIGLPPAILEKIYRLNFERLYGVRPAPLEE